MKNLEKQFKLNENCNRELALMLKENEKLSNRRNKFFQRQHEVNGYLNLISNEFDKYNFVINNPSYFSKNEFNNKAIDYYLSIKQMLNITNPKVEHLWNDVCSRYAKVLQKKPTSSKVMIFLG